MSLKNQAIENAKRINGFVFTKNGYGSYRSVSTIGELEILIENEPTPVFFEYIDGKLPVRLYFDFDIKLEENQKIEDNEVTFCNTLNYIKEKVRNNFPMLPKVYFIVLKSHSETKLSYHVIFHLKDENKEIYFDSITSVKNFVTKIRNEVEIERDFITFDINVYKNIGGLFRMYKCSKPNENRPLIFDEKTEFDRDFTFQDTIISIIGYNYNYIQTLRQENRLISFRNISNILRNLNQSKFLSFCYITYYQYYHFVT